MAWMVGLARGAIRYWALAGGLVVVALVVMAGASAGSNLLFNRPFLGDFELTKHGVAIAAFAFLPYTQLTYGNVTVDIFTERAGPRARAAMTLLASIIAACVALLLARQMWFGMIDYMVYREVMQSLRLPLWTAFPPALVSLGLLFVASLITAGEAIHGLRTGVWSSERTAAG